MKKISLIFALLIPMLFASCEFDETDLGFPDTVTFSAEGGEKVISGDVTFNYSWHPQLQDWRQRQFIGHHSRHYRQRV